jgi:hypothetical protein
MKRTSYPKLTSEQLVEEYVSIGSAQDIAIENFDNRTYNRLYPRKKAIAAALKSRPGDHRSLLAPLLQHPNWQVRLNTAKELLSLCPAEARATLEAISKSKHFPHAGDAGMCLSALDDGIFKPS